jgi:hypothetical protein
LPIIGLFDVEALQTTSINSSFSADYVVSSQNIADVEINITLENVGEYPTILTSYDLNLGYVEAENIRVSHDDTDLEFEMGEVSSSKLKIFLGETLLSVDGTYNVDVSYQIKNFFTQVGGSNEVFLPVFEIGNETSVDYIKLKYDTKLGVPMYSNTTFSSSEKKDGFFVVSFDNVGDLKKVILNVGDEHYFNFDIEKKLVNESDIYVQRKILFIPELRDQKILFSSVSPYPNNAYKDDNGNLILMYSVAPEDELWIRLRGTIQRVGNRKRENDSEFYLSPPIKTKVLAKDQYWWKIDDESIIKDIEDAPENNFDSRISWIYDYVLENLHLSENFKDLHGAASRKGGEVALKSYKSASVEDFADAFVALAREMDIPARVVTGYVFLQNESENKEAMYHVWPQYWDDVNGWVSLDPAYEKYTGYNQRNSDRRRIISSIVYGDIEQGILDGKAGSIYMTNQNTDLNSDMEVETEIHESLVSGQSSRGSLSVKNIGNTILYWHGATVDSDDLNVNMEERFDNMLILPGETKEIELEVASDLWYVSGKSDMHIVTTVEGHDGTLRETIKKDIEVSPLWWSEPATWIITILFFIIVSAVLYFGFKIIYRTYKFILRKVFKK